MFLAYPVADTNRIAFVSSPTTNTSSRSGLAGYVYTQDYSRAMRFAGKLEVGMVRSPASRFAEFLWPLDLLPPLGSRCAVHKKIRGLLTRTRRVRFPGTNKTNVGDCLECVTKSNCSRFPEYSADKGRRKHVKAFNQSDFVPNTLSVIFIYILFYVRAEPASTPWPGSVRPQYQARLPRGESASPEPTLDFAPNDSFHKRREDNHAQARAEASCWSALARRPAGGRQRKLHLELRRPLRRRQRVGNGQGRVCVGHGRVPGDQEYLSWRNLDYSSCPCRG